MARSTKNSRRSSTKAAPRKRATSARHGMTHAEAGRLGGKAHHTCRGSACTK